MSFIDKPVEHYNVNGVSPYNSTTGAGAQKDTDPNNHKGYIPQTLERHNAVLNSHKIVLALNSAQLAGVFSYREYGDLLEILESFTGVHWS